MEQARELKVGDAAVRIFPTKEALIEGALEFVSSALDSALASREGPVFIALSGGNTPKPLYEKFRHLHVEWSRIHVCFVDERDVPPDDAQSNYGMVEKAFLESGVVPEANIHRMSGELPAEQGAREYEAELRRIVPEDGNGFPRFDLVLLGIGPDGHTASLFPGSAALNESKHWVAANLAPAMKSWRITLTFPAINAAAQIAFLVAGADKAQRLAEIFGGAQDPPAAKIHPRKGSLVWMIDSDSASLLKQ